MIDCCCYSTLKLMQHSFGTDEYTKEFVVPPGIDFPIPRHIVEFLATLGYPETTNDVQIKSKSIGRTVVRGRWQHLLECPARLVGFCPVERSNRRETRLLAFGRRSRPHPSGFTIT